jgi:protoporphyrinogen oxidase
MIDAIIFRVDETSFMSWPVDINGVPAETGNMFEPESPDDSYFNLKYDQIVLASLYENNDEHGSTDHMWVYIAHDNSPIRSVLDMSFDDFKGLIPAIIKDFKQTKLH